MLVFLIAMRPACTTESWSRVCRLLNITLDSVFNQSSTNYKAIVLHHDKPPIDRSHPNLELVQCSFAPPPDDVMKLDQQAARELMRTDQGRKKLFGLSVAREFANSHTMFLDSDDLVSNQLVSLVDADPDANGWVFDRGYLMFSSNPAWVYRRKNFHQECGSSHILKTSVAPFPDQLNLTLGLEDYYVRRYHVHAYISEAMKDKGAPLASLPFPGCIYLCHGSNVLINESDRNKGLRKWMRWLTRGVRVTDRMRDEFKIPAEF